jgi:hypothetical protein
MVLVSLVACRKPGVIQVTLEGEVPAATATVVVYALADAQCSACLCGACFDQCHPDRCELGCDEGVCDVDELAELSLSPSPGAWALVIDFFAANGELLGSACAPLDIDEDGTASRSVSALTVECQ